MYANGIYKGDVFRLIVTGQYMAVSYNGTDLVLTPGHHLQGDIFHISEQGNLLHGVLKWDATYHDDNEKKEEEEEEENPIGRLVPSRDFPVDIYYFSRESRYLAQDGSWVDDTHAAVQFELNNLESYTERIDDRMPQIKSNIINPTIDPTNPTSADGIDLYHPDAWFTLYFLENDARSGGDVTGFEDGEDGAPKICFSSMPYGFGIPFRLIERGGKTMLQDDEGRFLGGLRFNNPYAPLSDDSECNRHSVLSKCECHILYNIGFVSGFPDYPVTIVPRGPPTMFVLYDGAYYYRFEGIKAGFAALGRVETIGEATPLQFVGA